MRAVIFCIVFAISVLWWTVTSAVLLTAPRNVNISSFNMDLVLTWDPPENLTGDVVYSTEYRSPVSSYRAGCVNVTSLCCDFTSLQGVSFTVFGSYIFRVHAQQGSQASGWVESSKISLEKHSTIGPPSVALASRGLHLDVSIMDPVFKTSSLRKTFNHATYSLTYWKLGHRDTPSSRSRLSQNQVVLPDLEPDTTYCVQVQIYTEKDSRSSLASNVVCETTSSAKMAPWVLAVVIVVVMVILTIILVVALVKRTTISHFLCPPESLPVHFKESLLDPPSSSLHMLMHTSDPPEELYHPVCVLPEDQQLPLVVDEEQCSAQPAHQEEERSGNSRTSSR